MKKTLKQETVKEIFWREYLTVKFNKNKVTIIGKNVGTSPEVFKNKVTACIKGCSEQLKFKEQFKVQEVKKDWPLQSLYKVELEEV